MLLNILLIFTLQLVYVPIMTLRTIFLVKNMSIAASLLGVVETLISIFSLSIIFSGDQSLIEKIVYAVGFGVGLYLGTRIENKLAIGYTTLYVNLLDKNEELRNHYLRKKLTIANKIENIQRRTKRSIDSLVNLRLMKVTGQVKEERGSGLVQTYCYTPSGYLISQIIQCVIQRIRKRKIVIRPF